MKNRFAFILLILVLAVAVIFSSFAESAIDSLLADGEYMEAIHQLDADGSETALARKAEIQSTVYDMAKAALEDGDPVEAAVLFVQLEDYADAADWAFFASSRRSFLASHCTGDIITFGSYEQDGNEENGPEPIEWIVLDTSGSEYLLLSRDILDTVQYSVSQHSSPTWENSTIRSWMNGAFADSAFSASEKQCIVAEKGDPVFALSESELEQYFPSKSDRRARPTAYAIAHDTWKNRSGYGYWWLKDANPDRDVAEYVTSDGSPSWYYATAHRRGIRPAIRFDPWADMPQ